MKADEVHLILRNALASDEHAERILDCMTAIFHAGALAEYSHRTYLPAARDYLRGRAVESSPIAWRARRARLGGAARWLYHHQRKTFVDFLQVLTGGAVGLVPDSMIEACWRRLLLVERQALARARRG